VITLRMSDHDLDKLAECIEARAAWVEEPTRESLVKFDMQADAIVSLLMARIYAHAPRADLPPRLADALRRAVTGLSK